VKTKHRRYRFTTQIYRLNFRTGLPQIESLKRKRNGYDFTRKSSHSKNLEQTKRQHRTKENANTATIIVCLKSNFIPQSQPQYYFYQTKKNCQSIIHEWMNSGPEHLLENAKVNITWKLYRIPVGWSNCANILSCLIFGLEQKKHILKHILNFC